MISMFSTESNGTTAGRSFMSYSGSIRSVTTMTARDGFLTKSTASLPQLSLSQQAVHESGGRDPESNSQPRPEFSTLGPRRNSRMRSMIDLPKAGKASGLSIAEERLRRYQRNAAIEAQHASGGYGQHTRARTTTGALETKPLHSGKSGSGSGEKGWFSSFNFGTRRFNGRTGSERRADREHVLAFTSPSDEDEHLLVPDDTDKEEEMSGKHFPNDQPGLKQDLESVYESDPVYKQSLPQTPAATPAANRQLPLVVSPPSSDLAADNGNEQEDGKITRPLVPKRAPRAFEDASDPPLAPMDARLLDAEMKSTMTQKVVCAVCHAKGVNFPSCRK